MRASNQTRFKNVHYSDNLSQAACAKICVLFLFLQKKKILIFRLINYMRVVVISSILFVDFAYQNRNNTNLSTHIR